MAKVTTQIHNDTLVVSINRPAAKNAIDRETAELLYRTFQNFDREDAYKVAVLQGLEGSFCSGADLKAIAAQNDQAPQLKLEGPAPLGVSRMRLSKPVIAAVEGYAVAGGLELALWCDLRVAAEDAVFGVFCRRFGVPLVDGGTLRLTRLIGQSRAMDMILTGRPVVGEEAFRMGLANRLVPRGHALKAALSLAAELSSFPQNCMRSDRLSVYEQWELNEQQALMNESQRGLEVIQSGETVTGAQQFKAK